MPLKSFSCLRRASAAEDCLFNGESVFDAKTSHNQSVSQLNRSQRTSRTDRDREIAASQITESSSTRVSLVVARYSILSWFVLLRRRRTGRLIGSIGHQNIFFIIIDRGHIPENDGRDDESSMKCRLNTAAAVLLLPWRKAPESTRATVLWLSLHCEMLINERKQ